MLVRELSSLASYRPSVLVIGSGPAGLIVALELARRDVDVALIESGFDGFDPDRQELATAEILAPERHAPMDWAVRRSLGEPPRYGRDAVCHLTISTSNNELTSH